MLGKTTLRSWLPGPEWLAILVIPLHQKHTMLILYRQSEHSLNALLNTPKRSTRQKNRKRSLEPQKARGQDWITRGMP